MHEDPSVTYENPLLNTICPGTLTVTNFRVLFTTQLTEQGPDHFSSVPHTCIEKISKKKTLLILDCKDVRVVKIKFTKSQLLEKAEMTIKTFCNVRKQTSVFAWDNKELENATLCVPFIQEQEYERFSVRYPGLESLWRLCRVNQNYAICDTYPPVLITPASLPDDSVAAAAEYRSRGRLPCLSYIHTNGASITRCAQPKSGMMQKKRDVDVQLTNALLRATPSATPSLYIMDARPKINAAANRAAGAGYENTSHYENASLHFLNIDNIHVMRKAYYELKDVCVDPEKDSKSGFLTSIEGTQWLNHILRILSGANTITQYIESGGNVLVHCFPSSDHQILTSEGFLDLDAALHQLESRGAQVGPDGTLSGTGDFLVAGLDARTGTLVYDRPTALLTNPPGAPVVDITQGARGKRRRLRPLSVAATEGHRMRVLSVHGPAGTTRAGTLRASELGDRLCRGEEYRVPSVPPQGAAGRASPFGLAGKGSAEALLMLYGAWWREGCPVEGTKGAVCLPLNEGTSALLARTGLAWESLQGPTGRRVRLGAGVPAGWAGTTTAKRLAGFVWDLPASEARYLLAGVAERGAPGRFRTECPWRRDEVVRLAVHAGCSADFEVAAAGEACGWEVEWTSDREGVEPVLAVANGSAVVRRRCADRTWCFRVPGDHVIVRRVRRDAAGRVVGASRPVITHNCSDGWDRTSQLTGLSMVLLDPYYRTLPGFMCVIDKEWLAMGHKFADRTGHDDSASDSERSPVFLQFVECIWHVMQQYPYSFEFNELFLLDALKALYSCRFGTFLFNCHMSRMEAGVRDKAACFWTYVWSNQERYTNSKYQRLGRGPNVLTIGCQMRDVRLWDTYYLQYARKVIAPSFVCEGTAKDLRLEGLERELDLHRSYIASLRKELRAAGVVVPAPPEGMEYSERQPFRLSRALKTMGKGNVASTPTVRGVSPNPLKRTESQGTPLPGMAVTPGSLSADVSARQQNASRSSIPTDQVGSETTSPKAPEEPAPAPPLPAGRAPARPQRSLMRAKSQSLFSAEAHSPLSRSAAKSIGPLSEDSQEEAGNVLLKRGYLVKQGLKRKNWKTRWFVLRRAQVRYFSSPTDQVPKGFIPISGHTRVESNPDKPMRFDIVNSDRVLCCKAENESVAQEWKAAIQECITYHQGGFRKSMDLSHSHLQN